MDMCVLYRACYSALRGWGSRALSVDFIYYCILMINTDNLSGEMRA